MNKLKATPGPWFVVGTGIYRRPAEELYEYNGRTGGVAGDKPIASVFAGWYGDDEGFPVEANAHLIAAAPEMYEALMMFVSNSSCQVNFPHACEVAETVLAKAGDES